MRLLDSRGATVAGTGSPRLEAASTTVTLELPPLDPGVYSTAFQVTSAVDGHVTSGSFAFLVDPTGTQPAPNVTTETESLTTTPGAVAARGIGLAGALGAVGILLFWWLSARPALSELGLRHAAPPWGGVMLAAVAAVGGLVGYLVLAARPIVEAGGGGEWFPLDPAGPFGTTPFANAMRLALLGALGTVTAAGGGLLLGWSARPALAAGLAAGILCLAGMSLAGHAAAYGGPAFAAVDLLHLLGVAAWLGTLLGALLLATRHRPALGPSLRRHSRVALAAAPLVVLTGLASSPLVLGDQPRELVASEYGNLLLAKALLFSAAVGIGAANFFLVRRGRFARSLGAIAAEVTVGGLAVLAAAGLVTGQPAAGRAPMLVSSAIGATHLYATAGASSVHVAVNLPAPGEQRYQVSVSDPATGAYRTDVQRVFLTFAPPTDTDLVPTRVPLEEGSDAGLWGATGAYTPVLGDWQLEVVVRRAGELDESATFPLTVREEPPPRIVPPPDRGIGVTAPLAVAWTILPGGAAGWMLLAGVLAMAALLFALGRRRHGSAGPALRVGAVALALLVGAGVGSRAVVDAANAVPADAAARPNPVEADGASVARGESLYLANCAACHGPDGAGDGPLAPGLAGLEPLSAVAPERSDGWLAHRIAVGTVGTRMPPFAATLAEAEQWDIVNYLRSRWPR